VLLSPGADAERLAALPKGLPVLLVWAAHDFGAADNAERLRVLGDRARAVTVPGSDHLLFDNTKGSPIRRTRPRASRPWRRRLWPRRS